MTAPFAAVDVVPPVVPPEVAARLLAEHWGLAGTLTELGSQQDRNWRVDTPDGRFVLKVANPAFPREELAAQDAALRHLVEHGPDVQVPEPVPALDGTALVAVRLDGATTTARVVRYLDGSTLADARHLAAPVLREAGRLGARTALALAGFDHPGAHRRSQWDVRHTRAVLAAVGESLPDADRGPLLGAVEVLAPLVDAVAGELPVQVCHADLNANNIVCVPGPDGRPHPVGVIDLGDLAATWRVADPAITVASLAAHQPGDPLRLLRHVVAGYVEVAPLTDAELAVLWPLTVWRAVVDAAATAHQNRLDPDNRYTGDGFGPIVAAAHELVTVPVPLATAIAREAAGLDPWPAGRAAAAALASAARRQGAAGSIGALVPSLAGRPVTVVPLDATSPVLADGSWEDPAAVRARFTDAGADGTVADGTVAVGRWGEGRLTVAPQPSAMEPASVHLGVDVTAPAGTGVATPLAGTVRSVGDREAVLACDGGFDLRVAGITPAVAAGQEVPAGGSIGEVAATDAGAPLPAHAHLQVVAAPGLAAPGLVPGAFAGVWRALCPDPSVLLGVEAGAPDPSGRQLSARRARVVPRAQERYYDDPPRIERGWGALLYDTTGRAYLDVVNNVASIGHSHPRLTAAVHEQLRRLNTNSRFHYDAIVELSERLAALLPEPLDTVFLVNSGSEADEIALRLARAATGRRDVLCIRGAYHGWTTATHEITTPPPEVDHPVEPWIHPVPSPASAQDPLAGERSLAAVAATLDRLAAEGRPPAAFLSEAVLGNAGGVLLPRGYLAAVYEQVRAAGGVCIADEVQVGYGRRGSSFWAFQGEGVVPDVVTIAKAAGNGVPFGAAITTRAIADAFAERDSFFSSAGGSPVSCVAATAVLDVIEAEDLQGNASRVGAQLRGALDALATRHEVVGAVHGEGLYLGVQLRAEPAAPAAAAAMARAVCDRLLERGVICQPTGERGDVLKIKPPLVLRADQAAWFVEQLDAVLTEGW